ncbi:N-methylhydantoinase B [Novosphingobium chloroacetimidivorans]|uniref:N-methylhydantoinase B n=1 Tax=Novosphingobium chloroacetimidivorans TaxID=1428314 RepID=A0A7W7K842_9SPHN|nr:hydantoinase B/oxoprolinase family protein [Novosphingobium chloroacetimidivorans]MBB4857965.1 N-methylhydantoinase B [Novosphingobium chloroacetimidivorans]
MNNTIRLQVLWNRLLALVEEQAQVLIRTAFSPLVRDCGDVSVGIFDTRGRMLAQAVTGTPGHVNTMAASVQHFLQQFPLETMREGDAFITNDPWKGTGHLNDFVVLTPSFHEGRCVALFCCTSHMMDVGGLGAGTEALDVFAEGLYLPALKLIDQGIVNETLMAVISANTRLPIDTVGDTYSLASCNDIGVRRLSETMVEFGLHGIDDVADHIVDTSRKAALETIRALPRGTWHNEMIVDGYDEPLPLRATMTIDDDGIVIDFSQSADCIAKGINVPLTYAAAYASFAISCAISPDIPNNSGSLSPVKVVARAGSILNAQKPSPVGARHVIGQMVPDLVFGCLAQIVPERVPAEGASCMWNISLRGVLPDGPSQGDPFALSVTTSGGMGARFGKDGLAATAFPSGIKTTPIEIAEAQAPVIFWRKELRPDSGGQGRTRGGQGQLIELSSARSSRLRLNAAFDRIKYPARGRSGGGAGAPGEITREDGTPVPGKGQVFIEAGQRLLIATPGGGGCGTPAERSLEDIARDLAEGRISEDAARSDYGHVQPVAGGAR